MITLMFFVSVLSIFHIAITNRQNFILIRKLSLIYSGLLLLLSLLLLIDFNFDTLLLQNGVLVKWLPFLNYVIFFGVDGLSLFFLILTTFLIFICILGSWNSINFFVKEYFLCFLVLDVLLILVFSVTDVLLFYIFFESILIPMFLIIGIWGSRERKIRAVYLFFFYTLVGSLFMLLAIIYMYSKVGSTNYYVLLNYDFSLNEQRWLWLAFFFSLATKMPLFPFHVWLPEAHVEAPTAGSVLLAGILLKLGSYGFLRYSITLFPDASVYFIPLVFTFSILGIIFTAMTAIRQTDFKRIIAYSSVSHMNLVLMGIFSFTLTGLEGGLIQSLSHGLVASALFFLIGILYDRYHTRLILYFGGLVKIMPLYSIIFLFFTMANIALPGTSSFVGEFLILSGVYKYSLLSALLSSLSIVLGACYSLWLFNRIIYGNVKMIFTERFYDLSLREANVLLPFFFLTILFGIFPNIILDFSTSWLYSLAYLYIL